jgi:hypothetical protein
VPCKFSLAALATVRTVSDWEKVAPSTIFVVVPETLTTGTLSTNPTPILLPLRYEASDVRSLESRISFPVLIDPAAMSSSASSKASSPEVAPGI